MCGESRTRRSVENSLAAPPRFESAGRAAQPQKKRASARKVRDFPHIEAAKPPMLAGKIYLQIAPCEEAQTMHFHKWIRVLFFLLVVSLLALPSTNAARQKSDEVSVTLTVTDKSGRCVDNISKNDLLLYDGKTQQEIVSFVREEGPVAIGILLDISKSMGTQRRVRVPNLKAMLQQFFQQERASNAYFICVFSDQPSLLSDWTRSKDSIVESINSLEIGQRGNTAFYDACSMAIDKLMQANNPRRALLVISDGSDNNSKLTYKTLREQLKRTNVAFYSIAILDPASYALNGFGYSVCNELASISGGKSFFPEAEKDFALSLQLIAEHIRCRYQISFKPAARDGKWHSLKIKIQPSDTSKKNLSLRYRAEYFSGAQ
jgi:Ca-activated chloride channel family protein